jgi:hypothetical protein
MDNNDHRRSTVSSNEAIKDTFRILPFINNTMIKKLPSCHYLFISNPATASSALTLERQSTQHFALHTSRQHPITSNSTNMTSKAQDGVSLTSRCPPLVQESCEPDSLSQASSTTSSSCCMLMHLLHDQNSSKFYVLQKAYSKTYSIISNMLVNTLVADDDEPFTIKRKLLRRRHVRKEQVKKRREKQVVKSSSCVENKEPNRRKRTAELRMRRKSKHTTTIPESPKMFTPKRCLIDQFNESADCSIVGITLVYPRSKTQSFHRIPRFSPVRPSKSRRQRRFV